MNRAAPLSEMGEPSVDTRSPEVSMRVMPSTRVSSTCALTSTSRLPDTVLTARVPVGELSVISKLAGSEKSLSESSGACTVSRPLLISVSKSVPLSAASCARSSPPPGIPIGFESNSRVTPAGAEAIMALVRVSEPSRSASVGAICKIPATSSTTVLESLIALSVSTTGLTVISMPSVKLLLLPSGSVLVWFICNWIRPLKSCTG